MFPFSSSPFSTKKGQINKKMEVPDLTVDDFLQRNININSTRTSWEWLKTATKVAAEKFEEAKGNPNSHTNEFNRNYHPKLPSSLKMEPFLEKFMIVKKPMEVEPTLSPALMTTSGRNPNKDFRASRSRGKGKECDDKTYHPKNLLCHRSRIPKEEPLLKEEESGSGITPNPTVTKKKRRSPNTDTRTNSSKKRRTNNQRKFVPFGPTVLPERYSDRIRQLTSSEVEPVLVIEKLLTGTDCCDNQSRLSMPFGMLLNFDFLDSKEKKSVGVKAMKVRFIDTKLVESSMMLKRWDMNKGNAHSSSTYNLRTNWNRVRARNGLGADDVVQVWAFRDVHGVLGFALVKVSEGGGDGGDGSCGGDGDGSSTSTFKSQPIGS